MEDFSKLKMPVDILNAALEGEKKTHAFYTYMSAHCQIDSVREFFENLKDEEYKHIQLIEGMLVRLRRG
jgi:rubrerythrin